MTTFQLVAAVVFSVLVLVTYRKELLALVSRTKLTRPTAPAVQPSIAITIVNDLISVTELRDKLAAEDCPEGVDACTALLRVIVEHTKKPVA